MGHRLPGVTGFNPPIWDKVEESRTFTCAIVFTPSGRAKMRQKGWDDAVDGKEAQATNPWYAEGYAQGKADLME